MGQKKTRLSETELLIMQLIWDMKRNGAENITAGDLMLRYPEQIAGRSLTTVLTLITRLKDKGFISIDKSGRTNYYIPLVREEEYKNEATDHFISSMYKDSPKNLIMALFKSKKLSEEEIAELRDWMAEFRPDKNP